MGLQNPTVHNGEHQFLVDLTTLGANTQEEDTVLLQIWEEGTRPGWG